MRVTTSVLLLLLVSVSLASAAPPSSPPTTKLTAKPNILFVLIDDMGYGDLSCFGGTRVKTPNIDKLAAEGIRFTQFYVNAPICSPSRVALMTGQYPNRWRITSYLSTREEDKNRGIADWLSTDAPTLARSLHDAGYYTAHVGKWHMGGQRDVGDAPLITQYGFDTSLTSFEGLGERVLAKWDPLPNGKPFVHGPTAMSAKLGGGPIHWVPRSKVTETFVDRVIVEMDAAQKAGKPFYINLWPDDVHSPNEAPPAKRGNDTPVANYLGVMDEMDVQFGRLFDVIRSKPELRDNTIIVVASDNGPERGLGVTGGLRGDKGQLYEGGIREPFIVWSPGKLAPSVAGSTNGKTVIAGMDLMPSLLNIAGVDTPANAKLDGVDLSDTFLGRSQAARPTPVMWVRPPDRPGPRNNFPDLAIRDGNMKLLVFRDGTRAELFDVVADPNEETNLASKQPELVKKLSERVIEWDRTIQKSAQSQ
jgi:arylsulfatase A-like enzyme